MIEITDLATPFLLARNTTCFSYIKMAVLEFSKIIRGKYATLFTEFGKGNKVQLTRKGTRISL